MCTMLRNLKILIVLPSLELGGAERQALLLARHLQTEKNALVSIWGIEKAGRVVEICNEYGLECQLVPFVPTGFYFRDLLGTLRFLKKLRQAHPDIIVPYTLVPNILCGLIWKFSSAKICIWNQRDEGFNLSNGIFYHRLAVKNTSFFIANSSKGMGILINEFCIDPSKVVFVRNGVELSNPVHDRAWWRDFLMAHNDDFIACMVANLHKYKDHLTLIRAWRKVVDLASEHGHQPRLVLAGRFDGTEALIENEISLLGLHRNITLIGKVDDISGLLMAVDIGVFSSRSEGSPNGVLECMAAGLPVVATNIPGIRDVVGSAGISWLSEPGDAEGLASLIITLLLDLELRTKISFMNKERIEKMFNLRQMCEKMATILGARVSGELQ